MSPWLLLILIIIGNLCLYWVLFGQRKMEQKMKEREDQWQKES
jgi:hypothetical protein